MASSSFRNNRKTNLRKDIRELEIRLSDIKKSKHFDPILGKLQKVCHESKNDMKKKDDGLRVPVPEVSSNKSHSESSEPEIDVNFLDEVTGFLGSPDLNNSRSPPVSKPVSEQTDDATKDEDVQSGRIQNPILIEDDGGLGAGASSGKADGGGKVGKISANHPKTVTSSVMAQTISSTWDTPATENKQLTVQPTTSASATTANGTKKKRASSLVLRQFQFRLPKGLNKEAIVQEVTKILAANPPQVAAGQTQVSQLKLMVKPDTLQKPAQKIPPIKPTHKEPTEKPTNKVLPEKSSHKVLPERSTHKILGEKSTHKVLGEKSLHKVLGEKSTHKVLPEKSTQMVPPGKPAQNVPPKNDSSVSSEVFTKVGTPLNLALLDTATISPSGQLLTNHIRITGSSLKADSLSVLPNKPVRQFRKVYYDDCDSHRVGSNVDVTDQEPNSLVTEKYAHGIPLGPSLASLAGVGSSKQLVNSNFGHVEGAWKQQVQMISLVVQETEEDGGEGGFYVQIWEDKASIANPGVYMFQCFSCVFTSISKADVIKHWIKHHTCEKPYKCHHCDRCFFTGNDTHEHILNVHRGSDILINLDTKKRLDLVLFTQPENPPFGLNVETANTWQRGNDTVNKEVTSYRSVKSRYKLPGTDDLHIEKTLYICRHCPFQSEFLSQMKRHSHRVESSCSLCLACLYSEYRHKRFLRNHIEMSHLEVKLYVCTFCYDIRLTDSAIRSHLIVNHGDIVPLDCAHMHYKCMKPTLSPSAWTYFARTLPGRFYYALKTTKEKSWITCKAGDQIIFSCKLCKFDALNEGLMEAHVAEGHSEVDVLLICGKCFWAFCTYTSDTTKSFQGLRQAHRCPQCGKGQYLHNLVPFLKRPTVMEEAQKKQTQNKPVAKEPVKAKKRAPHQSWVNRHLKLPKTEETLFKCEICDQLFVEPEQICMHLCDHFQLKPYSCPYCRCCWHDYQAVVAHVAAKHPNKPMVVETKQQDLQQIQKLVNDPKCVMKINVNKQVSSFKPRRKNKEKQKEKKEETVAKSNQHIERMVKSGHARRCFEFFKCLKCKYVSQDVTAVRRHIKYMHSDIRAYQCPYCPYKSVECTKIKVHQKQRHPRAPAKVLCDRDLQHRQNAYTNRTFTKMSVPAGSAALGKQVARSADGLVSDATLAEALARSQRIKKRPLSKGVQQKGKPAKKKRLMWASLDESPQRSGSDADEEDESDDEDVVYDEGEGVLDDQQASDGEGVQFSWYDEELNEMIPATDYVSGQLQQPEDESHDSSQQQDHKLNMNPIVSLNPLDLSPKEGPWNTQELFPLLLKKGYVPQPKEEPYVEMDYAEDDTVPGVSWTSRPGPIEEGRVNHYVTQKDPADSGPMKRPSGLTIKQEPLEAEEMTSWDVSGPVEWPSDMDSQEWQISTVPYTGDSEPVNELESLSVCPDTGDSEQNNNFRSLSICHDTGDSEPANEYESFSVGLDTADTEPINKLDSLSVQDISNNEAHTEFDSLTVCQAEGDSDSVNEFDSMGMCEDTGDSDPVNELGNLAVCPEVNVTETEETSALPIKIIRNVLQDGEDSDGMEEFQIKVEEVIHE